MGSGKDLLGLRFGSLTVIKRCVNDKYKYRRWLCRCDCGKEIIRTSAYLLREENASCGHIRNDKTYKGIESIQRQKYCNYRDKARRKNMEFEMTFDVYSETSRKPCFYCGSVDKKAHMTRKKDIFEFNGIDRVDNTKGYTLDNIVSCCKMCNYAKKNKDFHDFMDWINRLVKFQESKKEK